MYTCVCLFSSILFIFYKRLAFWGITYKLFLVVNYISKGDESLILVMEQAIHIVLNCSCACKHPWNHTQIWGGKQTEGLRCTIHICYGTTAPLPSGRNPCPPNKKAEKHQLAAITPGSPNTSKGRRSMRDRAAWHQCFSRFSGVFSSVFLVPWSCPVHCCSMPWWGEHVMDPHMGIQSCCLPEAPCTLPPVQHPQAARQLLSAPPQRT